MDEEVPQMDDDKWWLQEEWDEQFMIDLAGRWSINPSELGPERPVRGKCLPATVLD
jgi:hypothetical protein